MKFHSTGLKELDDLLGGNGVPAGEIVMIKGGPGTGKSTLGAHILSEAARQNCLPLYICVEENPEASLLRIHRSFPHLLTDLPENNPIRFLGMPDIQQAWDLLSKDVVSRQVENRQTETRPAISELRNGTTSRKSGSDLLDVFLDLVKEKLAEYSASSFVIVLDSITTLLHAIAVEEQKYPIRRAVDGRDLVVKLITDLSPFRGLISIMPEGMGTLYAITEQDARRPELYVPESYAADIVIELSINTVQTLPSLSESLLFCQVSKARGLPNQRRRCCYDFVAGRGLKFFPTYASEGHVSLFYENEPQRDVLESFEENDIPTLYPLVTVDEFSRAGMQRIFSVLRQARDIPRRKPMVLCNMDEYWIKVLHELPEESLLEPIQRDELHIGSALDMQFKILDELMQKEPLRLGDQSNSYIAFPQMVNVSLLVYRKDRLEEANLKPPVTWEDMEHICEELGPEKNHFLIETRTYDSFMAAMLELMWNHGAIFTVKRQRGDKHRTVEFLTGGMDQVYEAMERLRQWRFVQNIIPPNSTLDPRFHAKDNWVFARHWYSTLVDYLVDREPQTKELIPRDLSGIDESMLGVWPIPISKEYYKRQKVDGETPKHHSTWGEWYLAVERGTENRTLAIDLINNLMTDRRIVERALCGAALPPVEDFYESYGSTKCPCTDRTFSDVRSMFFTHALSRTLIDDYPTIARIFNGICSAIMTTAMKPKEVRAGVNAAFQAFESQ